MTPARVWRWFKRPLRGLIHIEDTPESIGRGVSIGLFFGFTPLFGLKTLLSLLIAVIFRANKISTVVAVSLHDLVLPFMPAIFRLEYMIGYWLLNDPHVWPERLGRIHLKPHMWLSWTTFLNVGVPLLAGSLVLGLPLALVGYGMTKVLVHRRRHELRRQAALAGTETEAEDFGGETG